ncbi:MAG: class I SAM-dependent methyltransferase [Thermodesulfobacteriota bacterium]
MEEKAPDTSRISITAHHTGYTWYAHGLSHRALTTSLGGLLYHGLNPFMRAGRLLLGVSDIETYLVQRHLILDHLMDREVSRYGKIQVLEMASGLSPRGMRFCARHEGRGLTYVEADLPAMAARKRRVMEQNGLLRPGHSIATVNLLAASGPESMESVFARYLSPDTRTVVVTEGIINYFPLPTVLAFWRRIAETLSLSGGGTYLADNMPELSTWAGRRLIRPAKRMVELAARGRTFLHFQRPVQARQALLLAGFASADVHRPESFFETLAIPRSRKPSFIQVLEASAPGKE